MPGFQPRRSMRNLSKSNNGCPKENCTGEIANSAFAPSMTGTTSMCSSSLNKPSSQEGLKPCPFCGSAARLSYGRDNEVCNVRCEQWGVGICLGAGKNCYSEDEAIAAWNTRHPSFNDAIEAAAKVAEATERQIEWPRVEGAEKRAPTANLQTAIAKAIRSLKLPDYRGGDSEKTAEK